MPALKAGACYFVLVFAAGFLLGPVRELWAVPQFGRVAGLLLEAVVIVPVMLAAARWCMRRHPVRLVPESLGMGGVALALLLVAELCGSIWLRGMTGGEFLRHFTTVPGLISLALFAFYAAMPVMLSLYDRGRGA
jgi:hypothetical protein